MNTNSTYENNLKLFEEYLCTDDVLLKPTTGVLKRRKHSEVHSFLYSSPMDTVTDLKFSKALHSLDHNPVFCRFLSKREKRNYIRFLKEESWPLNAWYSVGANKKDIIELEEFLSEYGTPDKVINLSVDVAHGDTEFLQELYEEYSSLPYVNNLMSGTVATPESALNVHDAGCTHIRVGIGPGSACSTRIVTGCGVPNLAAVFNIYTELSIALGEDSMPVIIADGGIRNSGDIVKYLAAGADAVMVGSLFSKTSESPGWSNTLLRKLLGKPPLKRYRGQASAEFQLDTRGFVSGTPEGVTARPQTPESSLQQLVLRLEFGVRSALSYLGLKDSKELSPKNVEFIKITQNGMQESKPHILS